MNENRQKIIDYLKKYFKHNDFKSDLQRNAIESIVEGKY